jgi:hypothetical protein
VFGVDFPLFRVIIQGLELGVLEDISAGVVFSFWRCLELEFDMILLLIDWHTLGLGYLQTSTILEGGPLIRRWVIW